MIESYYNVFKNRKLITFNKPKLENFLVLAIALAIIGFRFNEEHSVVTPVRQKYQPRLSLSEIKESEKDWAHG